MLGMSHYTALYQCSSYIVQKMGYYSILYKRWGYILYFYKWWGYILYFYKWWGYILCFTHLIHISHVIQAIVYHYILVHLVYQDGLKIQMVVSCSLLLKFSFLHHTIPFLFFIYFLVEAIYMSYHGEKTRLDFTHLMEMLGLFM